MLKTLSILILFSINLIHSQMLKPENGSQLNYIHVLFEWEQINDAISYNFQLDNNNDFTTPEIIINTSKLAYIAKQPIEWNSNYFWRIQPVYSNGTNGDWLSEYNFSTGQTRSNASAINYNPDLYNNGLTLFSSFFNYFSAIIDEDGNEIWNTGNNNIVYYNTDYFGQYYGCYVDNSLENYLPGIEFSINNEILWEEPNDHFLHHELIELNNGHYLGLIETTQLGPIPEGSWTSTFQLLGYEADGITNEYPWVGDKIVIWDSNTNQVIWEWNTFDHFSMLDYDTEATWSLALSINRFDWTHANALWPTYDESGNLESIYISSRHLSRITKINYPSGNVEWNMGLEMPSGDVDCGQDIKFSFQHSLMVENNGNIIFLDNGNLSQSLNDTPYPTSRGLEVQINENNGGCEAQTLWEYALPENYFGYASGNVQKLENGNYLIVTIGNAGSALEISPDNELIWEGNFALQEPNGAVYRANRVTGLYPVALSLVIENLQNIEGILFLDPNLTNNYLNLTVSNEGTSEEDFFINLFYNNNNSYSDSALISNLDSGSSENQSFEISNNINFLTLEVTPKHRQDLKKSYTIYIIDNDCDSDGDNICDDIDECPYDPDNDIDNDGICSNEDICPYDTNNDSDGDGSCDNIDLCIGNDNFGDTDGDGVCNDIDPCPSDYFNDYDQDGLCNSEDPCPDDFTNACGDVNPCNDNYSFLSEIPNSTIVIDNSNCFNNNDLSALNDIILLNNLSIDSPIFLGTQNWNNGRLTRLEIGNYFQGGNVLLTEIPNSIGNLESMSILYLNENALTSLPTSITNLSNLIYLVLSFNQITYLPENLGDLSNLVWIDAGYNELESIPDSVTELENLIYLWIFNNNLTSLPNDICDLDLDWNSLDYNFLPYFGSGGNQLCEDLPECIATSSNLNSSIDPLYYSFVITEEQDCESSCTLMDVNNDGVINVVDIVNTVNIIFNQLDPNEFELCAADANQDGTINVVDIVNIVNFIFEN